jgi:hypothetical protein
VRLPSPGDFFDGDNTTAATVDARHSVQKEDEKSPQGDERKAPFGELVVTGRRQMATRADCGRTLARSYGHFDALFVGTEVGVLVHKTPEAIAAV